MLKCLSFIRTYFFRRSHTCIHVVVVHEASHVTEIDLLEIVTAVTRRTILLHFYYLLIVPLLSTTF